MWMQAGQEVTQPARSDVAGQVLGDMGCAEGRITEVL